MALVQICQPLLSSLSPTAALTSSTSATLDAAGESIFMIGPVMLEAGSGSKTLDTSGFIHTRFGATVTFANGGTNLRIGIQDLAGGTEDGTFDVYADLVGGTDTISNAGNWRRTQMQTGSKSLTHGTWYAIGMEMTTRGGADSVQVRTVEPPPRGAQLAFPAKTTDTGAGPTRGNVAIPTFMIEFADGTIGWMQGLPFVHPVGITVSSFAINTTTTPDEAGAAFQLPYKCVIDGIGLDVSSVATTDTFTYKLYQDPFAVAGGPTLLATTSSSMASYYGSTAGSPQNSWDFISPVTLDANTMYAVTCVPSTTNTVNVTYYALTANCGVLKRALPFGSAFNLRAITRSFGIGFFTATSTDDLPILYLNVCQLDDGASSGSGTTFFIPVE